MSYSDRVAGARTTVSVLLTYDSGLRAGDVVGVSLPGFTLVDPALHAPAPHAAAWTAGSDEARVTLGAAYAAKSLINVTLVGLALPR